MVSTQEIQQMVSNGATVLDQNGGKIGKVEQAYLDDQTSEPEWVTVKTGMFGGASSFVPLREARVSGDSIHVPFSKDKVKDAPRVDEDSDGHLTRDEEADLYRYYGINYSGGSAQTDVGRTDTAGDTDTGGRAEAGGRGREDRSDTVGSDTSGPTTDDAMTRSEEQVRVGTEQVAGGKARLRKYVVTEQVTQTVPVSHEEVRIEREPITEANRGDATSGGDITSEEHEVTLNEERVVVEKETVPVERVRMDKETVTEEQQVSEEVRKEQIEADQGNAGTTGTDRGETDTGR